MSNTLHVLRTRVRNEEASETEWRQIGVDLHPLLLHLRQEDGNIISDTSVVAVSYKCYSLGLCQ